MLISSKQCYQPDAATCLRRRIIRSILSCTVVVVAVAVVDSQTSRKEAGIGVGTAMIEGAATLRETRDAPAGSGIGGKR